MADEHQKVFFFLERLMSDKEEIDRKDINAEVVPEIKQEQPLKILQTLAEKHKRAFFVLRSEVIAHIDDAGTYEPRLTLHSVFQGAEEDNKAIRKEIAYLTRHIKTKWRQKKTEEYNKQKQKPGEKLDEEQLEDAFFEDTKFGWGFRDLYIKDE
jgi:hypothetical protein